MKLRSSLVAALALTLAMQVPVTARAQETPTVATTMPTGFVRGPNPLAVHLVLASADVAPPAFALFARTPEEIRMSRGTKVAIIITAVVVGTLLIIGLVSLNKPIVI